MFKGLFTPLASRFDIRSPVFPPPSSVASERSSFASRLSPETPEDFDHDEQIQAMRRYVEDLKAAENVPARLPVYLPSFCVNPPH